jgi:DNA-binding HxlR family transcriptional regulator
MTTPIPEFDVEECPAVSGLKLLSGKWKPQIFRLVMLGPVRFNTLLRQLPGANKQSLSVALREMERAQLLQKNIISQKPLHIEYVVTDKGRSILHIFHGLEAITVNDIINGNKKKQQ